jgi:outer membrane receptor protein involved in Fe transport
MRITRSATTGCIATSLLAGASLLAITPAAAQDTPEDQRAPANQNQNPNNQNVILVTALKREQNLQDVPIAITAIGNQEIANLQIRELQDAVRFLPSVTIQSGGPGFSQIYFRGVASGENANHSASLPTVGTYLDEMPVTTIQGALDIHMYDINRIEALAGPQGTLYGASSMAGTVKIITNQPEPGETYGTADFELNSTAHGDVGGVGEMMLNYGFSDSAALRLVGWYRKDAGYIDNVHGTRTFPTSGIPQDNALLVEDDYNEADTYGFRAALGIDLDENWTVRPTLMYQRTEADGINAQERSTAVDDTLQVVQYNPEFSKDEWIQAALTIEGKLGTWDMVAAGGYLWRDDEVVQDYSDYAYFYDALYGYGAYFYDNNYDLVSPNQYIHGADSYRRWFGELRVSSPAENRLRVIGGLFAQRQQHAITQHYIIDGIADFIQVAGTVDNIWLTAQDRVDRDYAAFGEISYDITDRLTATGGIRVYNYKNSLVGFFGYQNPGFSSNPVYACQGPPVVEGSPCTNLDKTTSDTDFIHKLNLTYTFSPDALIYATWSRGFRPGGINRRGSLPPYNPDTLDNYELGWKTTFGDGFRFNGSIYQQDWDGIQLSFIGANGLTEIRNAGIARIRGIEADFGYQNGGFSIDLNGSYNDAEIRRDFCAIANPDFDCTIDVDLDGSGAIDSANEENATLAAAGTRLPVTARFKGNAIARYEFPLGGMWDGYAQGALSYIGSRRSDLRDLQNEIKGTLPDYATVDLSFGARGDSYRVEVFATNLFDSNGKLSTSVQCQETVCGDPDGVSSTGGVFYDTVIRPRTIGIKVGVDF